MKFSATREILAVAALVGLSALCGCVGGYDYALKRKPGEKIPQGSGLARRVSAEYPDWPVPARCRGATIAMRAGEKRTVVSEWGTPWKIGALSPGLRCEDEQIARPEYGGGRNDGNISLRAIAPGETRAWYVRAVGSGASRVADAPDPAQPADLIVRVLP